MKTKVLFMLLSTILIAGWIGQPLLAQEESCCGSMQEAVCAGCAVQGQEKVVKEAEAPNQTKCPVMGGTINKEVYTDYGGKRIYFCCAGCEKSFLEDADKFMKKMEGEGVVLDVALCPVSGKPAKTDLFAEVDGKKVYFCCEGCKTKLEKSAKKI